MTRRCLCRVLSAFADSRCPFCKGTGLVVMRDEPERRCSCPASFYIDHPGTHSGACPEFNGKPEPSPALACGGPAVANHEVARPGADGGATV